MKNGGFRGALPSVPSPRSILSPHFSYGYAAVLCGWRQTLAFQKFADRGETFAVDGARTELAQRIYVLLGRIAFVLGKAVVGVAAVVVNHEAVTDDFGDDAGGADEGANFVAVHDEQGRDAQITQMVAVH